MVPELGHLRHDRTDDEEAEHEVPARAAGAEQDRDQVGRFGGGTRSRLALRRAARQSPSSFEAVSSSNPSSGSAFSSGGGGGGGGITSSFARVNVGGRRWGGVIGRASFGPLGAMSTNVKPSSCFEVISPSRMQRSRISSGICHNSAAREGTTQQDIDFL